MKKLTNKQLRETLATTVSELNYNLNRVDATLGALHILKKFIKDNPTEHALAWDGVHGVTFLVLETLTELEDLRDNVLRDLLEGTE